MPPLIDSEFFNKILSGLVSLLLNYVLLDGPHSFTFEVYRSAMYVVLTFVTTITLNRFLKCPFALYKFFDQEMIKNFGSVKGHFKNRLGVYLKKVHKNELHKIINNKIFKNT